MNHFQNEATEYSSDEREIRAVRMLRLMRRCKPEIPRWISLRNAILNNAMPILVWCANRYANKRITRDDLLSEACLWTLANLGRFDPNREGGSSFAAFLFANVRWRLFNKVYGAKRSDRICSIFDHEGKAIAEPAARTDASLDVEVREEVRQLADALPILSTAEKAVIRMRYVDEAEPEIVAKLFGVHRAYTNMLEREGLAKLRRRINNEPPTLFERIGAEAARLRRYMHEPAEGTNACREVKRRVDV